MPAQIDSVSSSRFDDFFAVLLSALRANSVVEIVCVQILFLILDVKISAWAQKNDVVVRWNFSKDMFFLEQ